MINGRLKACSILMGCSSATYREFDQYGIILSYILAHCPCVVGNLWDVQTADMDKFSTEFLKSWLNNDINDSTNNICSHLIKAKHACTFSHLTGSAPVAFGLPLVVKD